MTDSDQTWTNHDDGSGRGLQPHHPKQIGKYSVTRVIASGGMGTVFHAVHEMLGREVAIKILHRDRMCEPAAVSRFRREIEATPSR